MAGNKKPRKKMAQRPALVPMMGNSRDNLAFHLHAAVDMLIHSPSYETADRMARYLAILSSCLDFRQTVALRDRTDADAVAVKSMFLALNAIDERFGRIQKWAVSKDEGESMKMAAWKLDQAMARIPANVFEAAREIVNQQCRAQQAGERLTMPVNPT